LALYQPAASSHEPGGPAGRIAIASKAPGLLTVVGLQGQPARELKVGYLPHETAAAGPLVFVSNYGNAHVRSSDLTNDPVNTLSVVDLSRLDAAAQAIDLGPARCAPHGLAVSRDRQRLYVTCEGRQGSRRRRDEPEDPARHSDESSRISHASPFGRWVAGVSDQLLARHRLVPRFAGEADSRADCDGLRDGGYRPLPRRPPRIHVVRVHQRDREDRHGHAAGVGRAKMGHCLGAVRVVPTPFVGRTLVVNCANNGRVLLVDAATLKVTHEIPVGTPPIGIAVPDDRFAYAANMADDTISVIDIRRGIVVRTTPAGDDPDGIVFFPG